ncbi:MAG TPA: hypothetical protein VM537_35845 [Anaerolineae bacterium]|nr:hypothetical protein [Anaerolineae bacterium]
MKYKAKDNRAGVGDELAQELGEELDALQERLGRDPSNDEVLQYALKHKRSHWYKQLEQDEDKIKRGHWLHQIGTVRQIIMVSQETDRGETVLVPRSIEVRMQAEDEETTLVRLSFGEAMTDAEKADDAIRTLFGRVNAYRDQCSVFPVFDGLVAELDRLGHLVARTEPAVA